MMKNKNVLLVSIVAVVALLAAGLGVYFLRKSAGSYDYKKVAYNFQGKVFGKDSEGLLAGGLVRLSSNNQSQSMVQVIKFKISPDARIFKIEGGKQKTKLAAADLGAIKTGDLVEVKADGLSVAGAEAVATDILIFENQQ